MSKRTILITGASSGIGKTSARYLHEQGYVVYGTSRKAPQGISVAPEGFFLLKMDVCNEASVKTAIATILEKEGRIDVIVNNAGIAVEGAVEDITIEELKDNFETNLYGVIRVCKAVLPIMRSQRSGHIINISSLAGQLAIPFEGAYSASKSALEGISESLSMEVRPFGIKVVIIQPGDINTGMCTRSTLSSQANADSPYAVRFARLREANAKNEAMSADPLVIGKLIEKVIRSPQPSLHYIGGTPLDKITILLKRVIPSRIFESLVLSRYEI